MVASTHVKFIYPPELLHQPVIYQLGRQFNIMTNIRRADISDSHGWVDMELQGEARDIQRALHWAYQQGLHLEPVDIAVCGLRLLLAKLRRVGVKLQGTTATAIVARPGTGR